MDNLFPAQKAAIDVTFANWARNKHSMFIVGQRGGKTTMLRTLIDTMKLPLDKMYGISISRRHAEEDFHGTESPITCWSYDDLHSRVYPFVDDQRSHRQMENHPVKQRFEGCYFLLDEAYYADTKKINTIILALHNVGAKMCIVSSRSGVNDFQLPDVLCKTYRYATWDWNPLTNYSDLFHLWRVNRTKAERDFGFHDSRMLTYEDIKRIYEIAGENETTKELINQ